MPPIELDLLLAYMDVEDMHHEISEHYFKKVETGDVKRPMISVFALQELEIL